MILKNLFTGQQWRNRHREQTHGRGVRGGEGELYGKSNMETYIPRCKIAGGICWMTQETQTGALYQPRGVGWRGRREGVKRRGKKMSKTYSASDTVSCYGKKGQGSTFRELGGCHFKQDVQEDHSTRANTAGEPEGSEEHDDLRGKSFLGRMVTRGKSCGGNGPALPEGW